MNYYIQLPKTDLRSCYRVGLVMPIYERPHYLRRCLASLGASQLKRTIIVLMDDASNSSEVERLIDDFSHRDAVVARMFRLGEKADSSEKEAASLKKKTDPVFVTLPSNIAYAFNYLLCHFRCDYFCILDSDTVMQPDWLEKLCAVHSYWTQTMHSPAIVSGFNTLNHPNLRSEYKHFVHKASLGGISMLFTPALYEEIFLPIGNEWDTDVVARMKKKGYEMLCTKPSVIQHIGIYGSFSKGRFVVDRAFDYGGNPLMSWLRKWLYISTRTIWRKIKQKYPAIIVLRRRLPF